jgi:hypothetical protein
MVSLWGDFVVLRAGLWGRFFGLEGWFEKV